MNLRLSRGDRSVWDEPNWSAAWSAYDQQRWIAAAGGALLAIGGARRGGFGGGLAATLGAVFAARALMGRHDLGVVRSWIDGTLSSRGWRTNDRVQDASEESFPASDSPSWTPTTGTGARRG